MGNVVVGLSISLDGFIAGPNDGPGNPLGDRGGRLFDWWSAGAERVGPDDRFKPPARSRSVVGEMFECGAIITGRRTFDILVPILLGDGVRMFANLEDHHLDLQCTRVVESDGVTHLR
jgi:hypothetical protein